MELVKKYLKKLEERGFCVEKIGKTYKVKYKSKDIWDMDYIFTDKELIAFVKGFEAGAVIEFKLEEKYML